ncbi:MAG: hypothetical protein MJ007_07560, partial [Paludibacteraceae bacterium]|nr:hypothetical protein [Paludibacteraceae bacterium]
KGETITDFTFELGGSATGYTISGVSPIGLTITLVSGKTYKISGTPSSDCDIIIGTKGQDASCVADRLTFKVTVNPLPKTFAMTEGGKYCEGGEGVDIKLLNSESGVNYTLYKDGVATSTVIAGTGSKISFGKQTAEGTYTAKAVNATTGCSADMTGNPGVDVEKKPTNNAGSTQEVCNTTDFTLAGTAIGNVSTWTIKSYDGTTNPTIENPTSLTSKVTGVELGKTAVLTLTTTSQSGVCEPATSEVTLKNKDCTSLTLTVTADSPICAGGTSNYKIEVYNGSTVKATGVTVSYKKPGETTPYNWVIGDIAAGGKNTKSEQYTPDATAATTTVNVSAYVSAVNGNTYASYEASEAKDKKDIVVNALPTASSSNVVNNTRCTSPYNGEYTITATGGSGTYTYSNDGGASYSSTATYPGLQSATVTAKVKDSKGCVSEGVSISVSDNSHAPIQYSVINGGHYCSDGDGMPVGLSKSETGFTYTLFRNGESTGISLPGTGNELKFGKQTAAGRYTAKAENATTGCSADMQGFTDVAIDPKPTNNAGSTQEVCNTTDFILAGTATGRESTWTIKSYDGTIAPVITNDKSLTSKVTGVELGKTAVLTLTTTSLYGQCTPATSDVTLKNNDCTNLTLTVTADSPICAGETSNYKIEVYNGSTVKATGVTVSYKKPGETTPYNWVIGDIASGDTKTKSEQYTPIATSASTTVDVSAYVSAVSGKTYASYEAAEAKDNKDIVVNALPTISYKVYKGSTEEEMSSPYTITCTVQSARVVLSGGATYKWSDSNTSGERTFTDAANLTVKSVSAEGCESSSSETIEISKNITDPTASITGDDVIDCTTTSVTLTANTDAANATYLWSTGATTAAIDVTEGNDYTVTVTNTDNGCSKTSEAFTVDKDVTEPTASITGGSVIDCTTTSVTLTANTDATNATYLWSTGAAINPIEVTDGGDYTVTVTNTDNGCSKTSEAFTVSKDVTEPTASITGGSVIDCTTTSVTLTANTDATNVTYLWSTGAAINPIEVTDG